MAKQNTSPLQTMCLQEYTLLNEGDANKINQYFTERMNLFGARCDYKVISLNHRKLEYFSNHAPEFVGISGIHSALKEQKRDGLGSLNKFKTWSQAKKWSEFGPRNHFDWWMFPISDQSSRRYAYSVLGQDIKKLKKNNDYMVDYLKGHELMFASWGWNLNKAELIQVPHPQQRWRGYFVRLRKAYQSLILFKMEKEKNSAFKFIQHLYETKQISEDNFTLLKSFSVI